MLSHTVEIDTSERASRLRFAPSFRHAAKLAVFLRHWMLPKRD